MSTRTTISRTLKFRTTQILPFTPSPHQPHLPTNHQSLTMSTTPLTLALSNDLTLPGSPTTTTPRLVYGTAWKKDQTADLVYQALKTGFRGIDTAAQPRHYQEHLVGDGLRRAISEGIITRKCVFLQTKFTSTSGQDLDNLPYDPSAPLEEQVHASVASSLQNLATGGDGKAEGEEGTYLDSLVLHSPLHHREDTLRVWQALSTYVPHAIRHLGIANTPLPTLEMLFSHPDVAVKPAVVQNRFYRDTGYESALRRFCRAKGVVFQSFWTLTGNPALVKSGVVAELARSAGVGREVAYYSLVLGLEGVTILDGTTKEEHMREDLEGIEKVEIWAQGDGKEAWKRALADFKAVIGEVE
ncbi:NADP-dependent oxidoreductase domain-containing protein [Pseudomassariella vexata]|uniref:NADP-dependent oxidoreductase domain-containing protein n=1 Tax=Pseudomassariella vexata TaxID=1141098 RepID=A0A1Y2DXW4_9PEZI|nr:NADP-dependent oxidoreductase domain-containing protein [Pseudomassariella vexata]ORY64083.1 NADP-dependent oxidoreductase domain-containing protein [Pseudomassariella vexata]